MSNILKELEEHQKEVLDKRFEKARRSHVEKQNQRKKENKKGLPSIMFNASENGITIDNNVPLVIVVDKDNEVYIIENGHNKMNVKSVSFEAKANEIPMLKIEQFIYKNE